MTLNIKSPNEVLATYQQGEKMPTVGEFATISGLEGVFVEHNSMWAVARKDEAQRCTTLRRWKV